MNCVCKKKSCKTCNLAKAKPVKAAKPNPTTTKIVRRRKGGAVDGYDKKVLIVVDVQNCFLNEGSYGINNGELVITILTKQLLIVKNVIEKIKKANDYELIVFSRDAHPDNHISYTVHPIHCRKSVRGLGYDVDKDKLKTIKENINKIRKDSTLREDDVLNFKKGLVNFMYSGSNSDDNNLDKLIDERLNTIIHKDDKDSVSISDLFITGSDLSYLFILCDDIKLRDFFYKAYYDYTFGFSKEKLGKKYDDEIIDTDIDERLFFDYNNKKLVVVDKGEYDNAESYSSFNYHYIKKPKLNNLSNEQITAQMANEKIAPENVPAREQFVYDELPRESKYSTGLSEIIKHKLQANIKLRLDVCGFVTEICVKQTAINGYYYLNFINNIDNNLKADVNIDYSLSSTLFGTTFDVYQKQIAEIYSSLLIPATVLFPKITTTNVLPSVAGGKSRAKAKPRAKPKPVAKTVAKTVAKPRAKSAPVRRKKINYL